MRNVLVVGAGGRTGTLFAEELKRASQVYGVAGRTTLPLVKSGKVFVEINGNITKFEVNLLGSDEISKIKEFEAVILTTKNPVSPILKEYLPKISNLKYLILSQNGFNAGEDALETVKEIYGSVPTSLRIIRLVLFNAVKESRDLGSVIISYRRPVRIAFGVFYGIDDTTELEDVFNTIGIEFTKVSEDNVKNMEFSKLFTNLIGIPSYSMGFDLYEGLRNKDSFIEEMLALKEYIQVVKKSGHRFLNFPHYPVQFFASIVEYTPIFLMLPFRSFISNLVLKLRGTKEKGNIDEIDYYTGAVVKLARELKIKTPVNERVLRRIKNERTP
ncbi:ketopantoate reductase family protein [Caldisericum sp.]|jgi:ketopantoate reductase|uniref:ketopantoate reductase family protein n=1 Tax=Caldisericum sp. TaxID=2499687 RepID=UPI003D12321F